MPRNETHYTHEDNMSSDTRHDPSRIKSSRDETKRDVSFLRSHWVQQVVDRLAGCKIGETVSYQELDGLIGGDHRSAKYGGRLQSARRIIQHDKQMVFGVVKGVGLVRLADGDIVKSGAASIARIRRESIRGAKRLACVQYESMSDAEKRKHDAAAGHLAVLAEFSRPATVKAIESKASAENKRLTFDETIAAFKQ